MTWLNWIAELPAAGFVVALAVGLLIGAERERRRRDPTVGMAGGLRTHVITALAGATAVQFPGVAMVVLGAAVVGALVVVAYARDRSADRGLTSEITLFATYLLGALAPQVPTLAAAIGAVIALVLALRTALHRFVRHTLRDDEALDVLLLAAAVLVVLPLLPDRAIDRFGVINPQGIWGLTLLVLGINAGGYFALRTLGPGRGLPLAGFFGGFVSSTATIGVLGGRVKRKPEHLRVAATGAVLSSLATPVLLLMLLAVTDRALFGRWMLPAATMALVAFVGAGLLRWRAVSTADRINESFGGRAFQPLEALVFSITVTALIWTVAWLDERFGVTGALAGIVLGGFADAHSAIATAGNLAAPDELGTEIAAWAVFGALGTNTLMKLLVAAASGGLRYAALIAPTLVSMLALAAAALAITAP